MPRVRSPTPHNSGQERGQIPLTPAFGRQRQMGPENQGYPQLYCKSEDSLGYMILSQHKTERNILSQHDFLFIAHSSATFLPCRYNFYLRRILEHPPHLRILILFHTHLNEKSGIFFFFVIGKNIILEWENFTKINLPQSFIISSPDIGWKAYVTDKVC